VAFPVAFRRAGGWLSVCVVPGLILLLALGLMSGPGLAFSGALCTDCGRADQAVLLLEAPAAGLETLVWASAVSPGEEHSATVVLRRGLHAYDLRVRPGWEGELGFLAGASGAPLRFAGLRRPTWSDHLDLFFTPELITWGQPNLLRREVALFGVPYDLLLVAVALGTVLMVWCVARNLRAGSLAGLVLAFVLMDGRAAWEHARTLASLDQHFFFTPWAEHAASLRTMARRMPHKPWCARELEWPLTTLVEYALIERPYGDGKDCAQWVTATRERLAVEPGP